MGQFRSPVNFTTEDSAQSLTSKLNDLVLSLERASILSKEKVQNNASDPSTAPTTSTGGGGGTSTSLSVTDGSITATGVTTIGIDDAKGLVLTAGAGFASISLEQDIHTTASPTFAGLTLTGKTGVLRASSGVVDKITDGAANTVLGMDGAGTGSEYKTVTGGTGITVTPTAGNLALSLDFTEFDTDDITEGATNLFYTADRALSGVGAVILEPTGFPTTAEDDFTFSFDDSSRTLTVTRTGSSYFYYIKGVKYTISATKTCEISDDEGIHFVYFGTDSALHESMVFPGQLLTDYALVCAIHWDATNNLHNLIMQETHGYLMPGAVQQWIHSTHGGVWQSGLALENFTIGNGSLNSHAQFSYSHGHYLDDDIEHEYATSSNPATFKMFYAIGATGNWRARKTPDTYPVIQAGSCADYAGTTRLAYNRYNSGTWSLTEVTNGNYVLTHIFASNDHNFKLIGIVGQNQYTGLAAARDGANNELQDLYLNGLPSTEWIPIGTVIYQTGNTAGPAYSNAVKAKIVTNDLGQDWVDWRTSTAALSSSSVTDHGLLAGLGDDDHVQYMHNSTARTVTAEHTISTGLKFGATPASAGMIRLTNNTNIAWRNAADSADILMGLDNGNQFLFGEGSILVAFTAPQLRLSPAASVGTAYVYLVQSKSSRVANDEIKIGFDLSANNAGEYLITHRQISSTDDDSALKIIAPDTDTIVTFNRDQTVKFEDDVTVTGNLIVGSHTTLSGGLTATPNFEITSSSVDSSGYRTTALAFVTQVADAAGGGYGYNDISFYLYNPTPGTKLKPLIAFGAEGQYTDAGNLDYHDFYLYDIVNGHNLMYINGGAGAVGTYGPLEVASITGAKIAAAGDIRMRNNVAIAWRNAGDSGNESLTLNASDEFVLTGPLTADYYKATGTVASAGAIRLANNTAIAWRSSENDADVTLTVSAAEVATFSGAVNAASLTLTTDLAILDGGTGASTAAAARVNILPSLSGNAGKYLKVSAGETDVEWATVSGGSPGGSDTHVQFNDGGSTFGGDAGLVYNKTTNILTISDALAVGGTVASAGAIRLANNVAIAWRNSENDADVTLKVTAAEVATFSGAVNAASLTLSTDLAILDGGTGGSTAQAARVNILPSMAGKGTTYYLRVNAATDDVEWATVTATAAAGGTDHQVQFNNATALDGTAGFTWDHVNSLLKFNAVAGSGLVFHTGSLMYDTSGGLLLSTAYPVYFKWAANYPMHVENTTANQNCLELKSNSTSAACVVLSISNSAQEVFRMQADGSLKITGATAGLIFQERDGSPDWQWYGTGGAAYLFTGSANGWGCDTGGNVTNVGRIEIQGAVGAATGNVYLSNATSNQIYWRAAGVAAPAYTTRSAGTKAIIYPAITGSTADYAIGINSSNLWFTVPDNASTYSFYGGTTEAVRFHSTGYAGTLLGFQAGALPAAAPGGLISRVSTTDAAVLDHYSSTISNVITTYKRWVSSSFRSGSYTNATIITVPAATNNRFLLVKFRYCHNGYSGSTTTSGVIEIWGTFLRDNSGTVTQIGSTTTVHTTTEASGPSVNFAISSTNILCRATAGSAGGSMGEVEVTEFDNS